MREFHLGRAEVVRRPHNLETIHHLVLLPGTQRILMANPFSNLSTPFPDSSRSRRYFVTCAWDAIALHIMLEEDVTISAFGYRCGAPIELHFGSGQLVSDEGKDVLGFLGTPVSKWHDNRVAPCSNTMTFFLSREHLADGPASPSAFAGEALSVETTIAVVTPISEGRATKEHQMPSKDELMARWRSTGLVGPFWTF